MQSLWAFEKASEMQAVAQAAHHTAQSRTMPYSTLHHTDTKLPSTGATHPLAVGALEKLGHALHSPRICLRALGQQCGRHGGNTLLQQVAGRKVGSGAAGRLGKCSTVMNDER